MSDQMTRPLDVYRAVTDSIVAAIEAGPGRFELPWHHHGSRLTLPGNAATGKRYRGVNVVALWAAAQARGFGTPLWASYRQWQSVGAQVRRGERASIVVFYKEFAIEENDSDSSKQQFRTRLFARASRVFNAEQVDGFSPPEPPDPDPVEVVAEVDAFVKHTGAVVIHGGTEACYSPAPDRIHMPDRAAFTGTPTSTPTDSYYAVLLHELVHWTGAVHRLGRDFSGRFGDDAYAMEELVAELGAAFLCAEFGITLEPRPDHAAYIGHWLRMMKGNKRTVFAAASKATAAADYLIRIADPASDAVAGRHASKP